MPTGHIWEQISWLWSDAMNNQWYSVYHNPKWVDADQAQYVRSSSGLITIVAMTVILHDCENFTNILIRLKPHKVPNNVNKVTTTVQRLHIFGTLAKVVRLFKAITSEPDNILMKRAQLTFSSISNCLVFRGDAMVEDGHPITSKSANVFSNVL